MSSDTLVYSAWSKDIDPLFATADKTMLYPTPTDIYSDRRMSDSTTSESNSPATEPDLSASLDPVRKPSLPGFDQLLEPVDPLFSRRPSMISDMSLAKRRSSSSSSHHHTLSSYSFPSNGLDSAAGGHGGNTASNAVNLGATTPATNNSPYSATHTDSPQFSTLPWNSSGSLHDSIQQNHQPHHQHCQQQCAASVTATSTSASGPFNIHSPKRRRSPAMTPPSNSASPQHIQQQLTPTTSNFTNAAATSTSAAVSPHSHSQPSQPQESQPVRRPRGKLPKHTTDLLKEWLHAHSDHPYPSEDEKRDLCHRTKLSMSQVSNWMINARRRILAPASRPQIASSVTSEAYRTLPRQIGSMYPSHMHAPQHHGVPGLVRRPPGPSQPDALRLYDTPYYDSVTPRYQAQSYPVYPQDRRLSYPNSVPPYTDFQSPYSQFNPTRDLTPRYFTSPTDSL